jgi:predicted enzyme related to lactoylglutathione lyase
MSTEATTPATPPALRPISMVKWLEIPVSNIQRSAAMYGAMLDLPPHVSDFMGVAHAVLMRSEAGVNGALIADPARPPRKGSGTVVYLHAHDGVARCLARALEAGATLVQPATAIGPHGTIALIEDLDCNLIGLHEHPRS